LSTRDDFVRDGFAMLPLGLDVAGYEAMVQWRSAPASPRIVAELQAHPLVGELLRLFASAEAQEARLLPSSSEAMPPYFMWHRDAIPHRLIAAGGAELCFLVAVDDFTEDNGATEFQAGSHRPPYTGPVARALMPRGHAAAYLASHVLHRRSPGKPGALRRGVRLGWSGRWLGPSLLRKAL
jgi:hypothetical protein